MHPDMTDTTSSITSITTTPSFALPCMITHAISVIIAGNKTSSMMIEYIIAFLILMRWIRDFMFSSP